MKREQKVILLLQYFGTGMMQPILALMLLARGCTLQTLPIAMAIYGVSAMVLELPSGIYADRAGRRKTYLLSLGFYLLTFTLALFATSFWLVAAVMVLNGAGRAFGSGSMDALIIDDFLEHNGEEQLQQVTSQMTVLIGCGIAAGALAGGLLPGARGYATHLILRLVLLVSLGALVLLRVPRDTPQCAPVQHRSTLANVTGIHFTAPLLRLLVSITCLSAIMASVETYWTSALKAIDPATPNLLLGVLSAASFGLLTLGSMVMGRVGVRSARGRWNLYFILQLLLGAAAVVLALQGGVAGFALAFLAFYLLMGADDVQEQTLLNSLAEKGNRAATLSAGSLVGQLGGLGASAFCGATVAQLGFGGIWKAIGLFSIGVFALLWLFTLGSRKNL